MRGSLCAPANAELVALRAERASASSKQEVLIAMAKFNGDDIQLDGRRVAVRFTSRDNIVECRLLERIRGPRKLGQVIGFGKGPDRESALVAARADCIARTGVARTGPAT